LGPAPGERLRMNRLSVWRVKVTGLDGPDRFHVIVTRAKDPAPSPGAELLAEVDGDSSLDLRQFLPPHKPRSVNGAEQPHPPWA
jgi:hypothetical protein